MEIAKLKFLITDDSSMMRDLIESCLKKMGAVRIDKAENGKEALVRIKKSNHEQLPYNLIFLDWEMPEMDGFVTLDEIRKEPANAKLPVFMVTTINDANRIKGISALKPNGYIIKPFTEELFQKKVLDFLQKI